MSELCDPAWLKTLRAPGGLKHLPLHYLQILILWYAFLVLQKKAQYKPHWFYELSFHFDSPNNLSDHSGDSLILFNVSRRRLNFGKMIIPLHRAVTSWPNGVASRRKLTTWVYLRLRLARPCVHLSWLAVICAHFGRDQICAQVKTSFSPFGPPTQASASRVTSINLL